MSGAAPSVHYRASLTSIGRSTHAAGTAGAHIGYILRGGAAVRVLGRGIPPNAAEAAAWMDEQERGDRSNARVCDTVILSLPHQLSHDQRAALVCDWCEETSAGVPYIAAIHRPSREGDDRNHHAHVVFRDRDPATGKRAMKTTDKDFADRMRESWERHVNDALETAGIDGRTDRRTLAARGIDRLPQLHVGPAATAAARRAARGGLTPAGNESKAQPLRSQARTKRNSRGVGTHVIDYPAINGGRTRSEENARRMAVNAARDRADARAASEARIKAARGAMAKAGLGLAPVQTRKASPATPDRTAQREAAAEATRNTARMAEARARWQRMIRTAEIGEAMQAEALKHRKEAARVAAASTAQESRRPAPTPTPTPAPAPTPSTEEMLEILMERGRALPSTAPAPARPAPTPPAPTPARPRAAPASYMDMLNAAAPEAEKRLRTAQPTPAAIRPAGTPAMTLGEQGVAQLRAQRQAREAEQAAAAQAELRARQEEARARTAAQAPIGMEAATAMLSDPKVVYVNKRGEAAMIARPGTWEGAATSPAGEPPGLHGIGPALRGIGSTWTDAGRDAGGWHVHRTPVTDLAMALARLAASAAADWIARLGRATAASWVNSAALKAARIRERGGRDGL